VEFTEGEDKLRVEGPPDDVQQAKKVLEEIAKDLVSVSTSYLLLAM
jgi:hypothetical protein